MSVCATCRNPLTIAINDDDEDGAGNGASSQVVPDDVELSCGCHYHWYEIALPAVALNLPDFSNDCQLTSIVHQAVSLGCVYDYGMPCLRTEHCELYSSR